MAISYLELRRDLKQEILLSKEKITEREDRRGDSWNTQDSNFYDYLERFFIDGKSFNSREYSKLKDGYKIIDDLQAKSSPVVIDFMSTTAALASLFYDLPQEKKLGIAIGRRDNRTDYEKKRDERLGIHQIAGDIMDFSTWKKIKKVLDDRKADLIVESGLLGVAYLPVNSNFYGTIARRGWNLLNPDGGLMIVQTDRNEVMQEEGIKMAEWIDRLHKVGIEAEWDTEPEDTYSIVKVMRSCNSPKKLPLLI